MKEAKMSHTESANLPKEILIVPNRPYTISTKVDVIDGIVSERWKLSRCRVGIKDRRHGAFSRANQDFRWPGGVIPYVIHRDLRNNISLIETAMRLMMYTTDLKFVRRKVERDFIHIQSLKGCYSYVGRVGGEQPLSLGKGCIYIGTITHELMHAVGFYHEHSRPDRDKYIDVFLKNVEPDLVSPLIPKHQVNPRRPQAEGIEWKVSSVVRGRERVRTRGHNVKKLY
ncbi:hypothetical protein HPB50_027213 [Hyalomma asiaticum]|uniref:Uncharacterized protein n=1 Tax=Hyalomma asiaticum TaxID=266040 RepID=A0ACB7SLQ1_HYAAI|nr:hypothetical protein HPB50_027213 [Hyalomma asiaticum]